MEKSKSFVDISLIFEQIENYSGSIDGIQNIISSIRSIQQEFDSDNFYTSVENPPIRIGQLLFATLRLLTLLDLDALGSKDVDVLSLWMTIRKASLALSPTFKPELLLHQQLLHAWCSYFLSYYPKCLALHAASTPEDLVFRVNMYIRNPLGAFLSLFKSCSAADLPPDLLKLIFQDVCLATLHLTLQSQAPFRAILLERIVGPVATVARLVWRHPHPQIDLLHLPAIAADDPVSALPRANAQLYLVSILLGHPDLSDSTLSRSILCDLMTLVLHSLDYLLVSLSPRSPEYEAASRTHYSPQVATALQQAALQLLRQGDVAAVDAFLCQHLFHPHPFVAYLAVNTLHHIFLRSGPAWQQHWALLLRRLFHHLLHHAAYDRALFQRYRLAFLRCGEFLGLSDIAALAELPPDADLSLQVRRNILLPFDILTTPTHVALAAAWLPRILLHLPALVDKFARGEATDRVLAPVLAAMENISSAQIEKQLDSQVVGGVLTQMLALLSADRVFSLSKGCLRSITHVIVQFIDTSVDAPQQFLLPMLHACINLMAIQPCYYPVIALVASLSQSTARLSPALLVEISKACRQIFSLCFAEDDWLLRAYLFRIFKSFALTFPSDVQDYLPPSLHPEFVNYLKQIPICSLRDISDPEIIRHEFETTKFVHHRVSVIASSDLPLFHQIIQQQAAFIENVKDLDLHRQSHPQITQSNEFQRILNHFKILEIMFQNFSSKN